MIFGLLEVHKYNSFNFMLRFVLVHLVKEIAKNLIVFGVIN